MTAVRIFNCRLKSSGSNHYFSITNSNVLRWLCSWLLHLLSFLSFHCILRSLLVSFRAFLSWNWSRFWLFLLLELLPVYSTPQWRPRFPPWRTISPWKLRYVQLLPKFMNFGDEKLFEFFLPPPTTPMKIDFSTRTMAHSRTSTVKSSKETACCRYVLFLWNHLCFFDCEMWG